MATFVNTTVARTRRTTLALMVCGASVAWSVRVVSLTIDVVIF